MKTTKAYIAEKEFLFSFSFHSLISFYATQRRRSISRKTLFQLNIYCCLKIKINNFVLGISYLLNGYITANGNCRKSLSFSLLRNPATLCLSHPTQHNQHQLSQTELTKTSPFSASIHPFRGFLFIRFIFMPVCSTSFISFI